jgi:hypothetical protein
MSASKTIGGINVTVSATIDKFAKAMTMGRKLAGKFVLAVKALTFSLKGLTAALTVGAFVKFTANQFKAIDALGDLSAKLGVSTEKLAGLQLAATEAGISHNILERSLTTLSNKMGTSGDRALRSWIEKTAKLTSHQDRLAAATEMFGAKGSVMVRLVTGGTGALDEAQKAAINLGLALDQKTVAGVDRAMDAFGRFKLAVSGIFRSLAAEIAPFIEVLSNKATGFLATNGRGKGIGATIANAIIKMTKLVADGIQKMVGGVLEVAARISEMVFDFRSSAFGKKMGVGFNENAITQKTWYPATNIGGVHQPAGWREDIIQPARRQSDFARDVMGIRSRADAWNAAAPWSSRIEGTLADARRRAAEQAAFVSRGPGLIGRGRNALSGLLGTNNALTAKDFGSQLIQGVVQGIRSVPGLINQAQWAGMMFQGNNFKGAAAMGQRPSLAFAESGSADSYRQQAAIRRQSESEKIEKQQLAALNELVLLARQGGGGIPVADI